MVPSLHIAPQVASFRAPITAQLSSQVTDSQIRLIILALIGVAVLLGLLTIWYAIHTSPRRRQRLAARTRAARAATQPEPTPAEVAAARRAFDAPQATAAQRTPTAEELDDAWVNLTGPTSHDR